MSQPLLATALRAALCAAFAGPGRHGGPGDAELHDPHRHLPAGEPADAAVRLRLTNGAVRKAGRNPPSSLYFCDVPIDDLAVPSYNRMELQFTDKHTTGNGHVVARLMRRNLQTGAAVEVARASSVPSASLRTAGVSLAAPMDFRTHEYYVLVSLQAPVAEVEAHTVRFVTR
jgi:hypothetical protein